MVLLGENVERMCLLGENDTTGLNVTVWEEGRLETEWTFCHNPGKKVW
jgi:hypothetical protein